MNVWHKKQAWKHRAEELHREAAVDACEEALLRAATASVASINETAKKHKAKPVYTLINAVTQLTGAVYSVARMINFRGSKA